MTDAQLGGSAPARRGSHLVAVLLGVGAVLTLGGAVGGVVAANGAGQGQQRLPIPTLAVGTYSGYQFPHAVAPDYAGAWIGAIVTAIGAIALIAGIVLAIRRAPKHVRRMLALVAPGALIAVIGVVWSVQAKWAADAASYLASQPKSVVVSDSLALTLDPRSAQDVAPDYTLFWIAAAVTVLGVIAILAGALIGSRPVRSD